MRETPPQPSWLYVPLRAEPKGHQSDSGLRRLRFPKGDREDCGFLALRDKLHFIFPESHPLKTQPPSGYSLPGSKITSMPLSSIFSLLVFIFILIATLSRKHCLILNEDASVIAIFVLVAT